MEKVFASVWLYLEISVAVARTLQMLFPLAEISNGTAKKPTKNINLTNGTNKAK